MMTEFPTLLKKLHQIEIDYDDGNGIDFEPYQDFMPLSEANEWLKHWTGNEHVDASSLLVFGQDGSGGYVAFWLRHENKDLLDQPIVFLGSEGQTGVVAKDFNDYLWLFSQNHGPSECIELPEHPSNINHDFLTFAEQHSKSHSRSVDEILKDAQSAYLDFNTWIESLIR